MKNTNATGLGKQAGGLTAPKIERTRYLMGLSEGCKHGFLQGLRKAKEEIARKLLDETELSAKVVAELIGLNLDQMEGLAK